MLDPSFGPLRFLIQRPGFEDLMLHVTSISMLSIGDEYIKD